MKYRKILTKYTAVFYSCENIKVVFHSCESISCISQVKFDVLCFPH